MKTVCDFILCLGIRLTRWKSSVECLFYRLLARPLSNFCLRGTTTLLGLPMIPLEASMSFLSRVSSIICYTMRVMFSLKRSHPRKLGLNTRLDKRFRGPTPYSLGKPIEWKRTKLIYKQPLALYLLEGSFHTLKQTSYILAHQLNLRSFRIRISLLPSVQLSLQPT